ncbi:MAG: DUF4252 domain-containing protein [Bacteroidales bacterium]|nr:DUF4252 domain-containing protein [Bacteroidales bacterium]
MKRMIAFAALLLVTVAGYAQAERNSYKKYSDEENVSAVYISPAMFKMMGRIPSMNLGDGDKDITPVIRSLSGMYLIDSENREVSEKLKADVQKMVRSGEFELMMEVKDSGETVNVFTSGKGDNLTGFVLLSSDGPDCTFISLSGNMSRKKLEEIISKGIN